MLFLRHLLSEDSHSDASLADGFPVNRMAFTEHREWEIQYALQSGHNVGPRVIREIPESDFETLEAYVESLGHIQCFGDPLHRLIRPDLTRFYAGEVSAEETAEAMQRRVTTYLTGVWWCSRTSPESERRWTIRGPGE